MNPELARIFVVLLDANLHVLTFSIDVDGGKHYVSFMKDKHPEWLN
jgi:hypothetical protein